MKKLLLSMGLVLAASALTNCAKDDTTGAADKGPLMPVTINADLAATRTEISRDDINSQYNIAWKAEDKLYVSAFTDAEKDTDTWTWGKPYKTNAPRIYAHADGAFTIPADGHIPAGTYTFTAIYADASQATYPTSNKLENNQTQDCNAPMAHLANYDCMVGTASVTIPDAQPSFTMKHIYSWLKITVSNATGAAATVKSVAVSSKANLAGLFNITDFATGEIKPTNATNVITLNLENAPETADGGMIDTYLVMAPMNLTAVDFTITVTTADGKTYKKLNNITNNFEAGKIHSATFTMDASAKLPDPIYTVGFEAPDFKATSSYPVGPITVGPDNNKWEFSYGNVISTSAVINGEQSVLIRRAKNTGNVGYARPLQKFTGVKSVTMKAKSTNLTFIPKLVLLKSVNDGADWTEVTTFDLTTNPADYVYTTDEAMNDVMFKISPQVSADNSTSNVDIVIDDFTLYNVKLD